MTAAAPLDGVVVLDLSKVLAGPYCTMILGDLGADVIKVEHPQGDESRQWGPPFVKGESVYFLSVNRNKRSIVIDLKDEAGQAFVRRIAAHADVLVENFLPDSWQRLGLSLAELRAANPRLITLTISGMGASGPEMSSPGYDFIMQAAGGLMSITGPAEGPPSKVGVAVVDLTTGMMAANAVLAALYARERTGRGQHIDISLFETQLSWLANVGTAHLMTGAEPVRHGNAHPTIVPYQTFALADGDIAVGVGNDGQFARFCEALGFDDVAADERYRTNAGRVAHRSELITELTRRLSAHSLPATLALLRAAHVPASSVRTVSEALADPQVAARDMVQSITHPTIGEVRLLGIPFKFSESPASIRRHPPVLGEHTEEITAAYR